jgi:penicillin amidase
LQFPDGKGGQRRVVGVTLPGAPVVVVGSNGHVAWGFTNSYGDYLDLVALDTDAARPGKCARRRAGKSRSRMRKRYWSKARRPEKLVVRETSLGPIREVQGRSYAVHWAAHAPAAVNVNAQKLEFADTLEQALAIAPTMGIPAQNFVGGDDQGNIGWTIAGPLPRRASLGMAIDLSAGRGDQAGVWQGWLAPEEYPKVVNPASGQLATANSRQLAGAGAELIGDGGFDLGARTHQVRDDLAALGAKTDVKKVYAIGLDDRAIFLTAWRERAIAVLDPAAIKNQSGRAEALKLLKESWSGAPAWTRSATASRAPIMYALYDMMYDGANDGCWQAGPESNMARLRRAGRW